MPPRNTKSVAQMAVNRRRWDEVVQVHADSDFYDLEGFRRGTIRLHPLERREVGPVRGRSLLHLQCHFGLDTLSWARLGARVTGVDYSPKAIALARRLARDTGIGARFIESDLYLLPRRLRGSFDIVFSSYGALSWLPDIDRWAKLVARYVRPGGFFYIAEGHPWAGIFDDESKRPPPAVVRPYFPGPAPLRFDTPGDYADFSAKVRNRVTYEWGHPLGEIVTSLSAAGLRIEFLHEHPFAGWRMFPFMRVRKDGWWHLPASMPQIPLMFSLKASKPARRSTRGPAVAAAR